MRASEALLPLEDYSFTIRSQAFTYTGSSWGDALGHINSIRLAEDQSKYYHGIIGGPIGNSGTSGIARLSARVALSRDQAGTIAHEFGHNLSLNHTDCGGPDRPEQLYPYAHARTGNWGYDILNNNLLPPDRADFMSYCGPSWIGSFNFNKIIGYMGAENAQQNLQFFKPVIEDPTIITGTITGDAAVIDNVFDISGVMDLVLDDERYSIELIGEHGSVIYEAAFIPFELDHENKLQFDIGLPRDLLAKDTYEIRILRDNTVLLQEFWLANVAMSLSNASAGHSVTRLDSDRVEILWSANGQKTLWVTDLVTNNVLTIDRTGRVVVHTTNNRLELKYTEKGHQERHLVELEQ